MEGSNRGDCPKEKLVCVCVCVCVCARVRVCMHTHVYLARGMLFTTSLFVYLSVGVSSPPSSSVTATESGTAHLRTGWWRNPVLCVTVYFVTYLIMQPHLATGELLMVNHSVNLVF